MNMTDIEWILRRLADSSILAHPEHVSLEAACRLVAILRQNLNYDPDKTSSDEVVLLIQKLAKGQQ
jgi:hypothetical protein